MRFTIHGRRYRLRTDIWAERLGWVLLDLALLAMLVAPIAGYCMRRW